MVDSLILYFVFKPSVECHCTVLPWRYYPQIFSFSSADFNAKCYKPGVSILHSSVPIEIETRLLFLGERDRLQNSRRTAMVTKFYPFANFMLLRCVDQMLGVMVFMQHRVWSSNTVRLRIPVGARCVGHVRIIWSAEIRMQLTSIIDFN